MITPVDIDIDFLVANLRDEGTKHTMRGDSLIAGLLDSIASSIERAVIEKEPDQGAEAQD